MNREKSDTISDQQLVETKNPTSTLLECSKGIRTSSANICPTCEKTFERLYNLKVHLRKHTGETPYDCPIRNCSKQFKWRSSMAHHVRAHHTSSESTKSDLPPTSLKVGNSRTRPINISTRKKRKQKQPLEGTIRAKSSTRIEKPSRKRTIQKYSNPMEGIRSVPSPSVSSYHIEENSVVGSRLQQGAPILLSDGFIEEPFFAFDEEYKVIFQTLDGATANQTSSFTPGVDTVMESELPPDSTDQGLSFLAPGSEDATDAEMETLAQIGGHLSSPEPMSSPYRPLDIMSS